MSNVDAALAKRDNTPAALIDRYANDFATVLPSHIKPDTWVRLAQGALRRNPTLQQAAAANPGSLLACLLDAARLGLEPGTEQYYLVPYKDRGRPIVQGVPGYQGEIELMYRAGAVSSVIVEVVRDADGFTYRPGRDERPMHDVDWFGADRGGLVGVYAYATMVDGPTSKVVVLGRREVEDARASSASFKSKPDSSPWTTHEEAMWLKTAAHRLRKWVPTSAEYRREQLRAAAEAQRVATAPDAPAGADLPAPDWIDGDAENVTDEPAPRPVDVDWPDAAQPPDGAK